MVKCSSTRQLLPLLLLIVSLAGCGMQPTTLPTDSQPVKAAAIPALPPQARQLPTPPECLPTCSGALMNERESWRQMLIKAGQGV